ncbi:hypothetical protein ONZ51_g3158 [Trametes cubensis]|uniref:Berberine/berberine-like domain-containing protein n=1 Tax=Trametes cubensis TaxID=1111947 RepID=A0AAD7U0N0_9APHY|nr:hypothetical protein ONZ51_g3158 [Trametes cubensis]
MEPPLPPSLKLVPAISDALFDELASSVKGPVLRPADPEYFERSRTFNGKLKSLSRLLVSPLDAQDVSTTIKFCVKYGLSPSVRAGGYGIAGWAVAGDVIIDMSMITDIDIEPPRAIPEGEDQANTTDWTPLREYSSSTNGNGNNKGKNKIIVVAGDNAPILSDQDANPHRAGKRRREDSPPAEPRQRPTFNSTGIYGDQSNAVASFLQGPPLPPDPNEPARQPPLNRPRLHSPEPDPVLMTDSSGADSSVGAPPDTSSATSGQLVMPPLTESSRQLSGDSASSDASSRQSTHGSSSSSGLSQSSATTVAASPSEEQRKSAGASTTPVTIQTEAREPFSYLAAGSAPSARLPMYSAAMSGSDAFSAASTTGGQRWAHTVGTELASTSAPDRGPEPGIRSRCCGMESRPRDVQLRGALWLLLVPEFDGRSPAAYGRAVAAWAALSRAAPVHPHAYVTFGAGMRQKEIDQYTADHPFEGTNTVTGSKEDAAVPYHVPMSAHPVGSSIMLLAGFGFISRMYGLSIDNVVEVEMVLADGRIVVVNAEEDPELWWAIRGAGPAFGIATRYKARAFPVPVVFAGNLVYRFHRATAPSLIKHFRDCIKGAPRELYANVLLTAGPADKDSLVVIQMCYVGPKEKGMEFLQAISSWDGERCLLNEVNEKSFLRQQESVAQVLRGKAGRQWFMRSALITTLPDEVINRTVLEFADTPIGCTWLFELAGGAIADFEDTCLPKEQREATWTVAALHQWDMGVDDPRCITTAEQWIGGIIKPVAVGGPYPTFLGRHEPPARTMACYGKHWERLAALKRKYDPDNVFKNNFWPLDKDGRPIMSALVNEPPSP